MSKYQFNVNNFSIEKDERFFAYINTIDANRIVKMLNEQEREIQRLKRHIERNTISRITVEDVLSCAKDSRFYGNEEIAEAIDCIAKDLGVNLY